MILYSDYDNDTGIIISKLVEYNKNNIKHGKRVFKKLKKNNIIIGNFDDVCWILNDEFNNIKIKFIFDEIKYIKEAKRRNMYTFEQFINSIKSYIVLMIKKRSLENIATCFHALKRYIIATNYFNKKSSKEIDIKKFNSTQLRFIEGYINFVEFDGIEYYTSLVEEEIECVSKVENNTNENNRRKLCDFQSILLFNRIIEEFWQSVNDNCDIEKKALYFPLYIWWRITNIIPLRLQEFCVTPYDCTRKTDDEKYYIKLRRSNLKGGRSNSVQHKIEYDYSIHEYAISKEIYSLISEYKKLTQGNRKDTDILLCYETYRINKSSSQFKVDNKRHRLNSKFVRRDLNKLLNHFFVYIVQHSFSYKLLSYSDFIDQRISTIDGENNSIDIEFKPLEDKQITVFRPGDIRHYAMINMVLNDINPILVKELVDHENINTTFHYFGNIDELVTCISYLKYKDICSKKDSTTSILGKEKVSISINKIFNQLEETKSVQVDHGRCISKYFISGKLNDCIVVDGECENCDLFIKEKSLSKKERKERLKILESRVQEEAKLIEYLLTSYKNTSRVNRELVRNKLKLQNSIVLYSEELVKNGEFLWEQ